MAITIADAPPPEPATMSIPQGSERATFAFRNYKIHLIGPLTGTVETLQREIARAKDLSEATRVVARHYLDAGYPASRVHYMLMDEELFLVVRLGQVAEVEAPERLKPYFEDVTGAAPLRDVDIEPQRVLASLHADRMGSEVAAVFEPTPAGTRLRLLPYAEDLRQTRFRAEIGNPGNRFTGRHFLDLSARRSFDSGDELAAVWQTTLKGLNSGRDAQDYDDYSLGWNRVTTRGLFGLSARKTDYEFEDSAEGEARMGDAGILQIESAWLYPLVAGQRHRWVVNAKLDYTHKEAELYDGTTIQDEEYGSAEGGLESSWQTAWGEAPITVEGGVQVRRGLGDEADTANEPDLNYLLMRPRLLAGILLDEAWDIELQGDFQLAKDTVPEQSQWVLGGLQNLTAYLPGVAVGDSGGLLRLQLSYFELPAVLGVEIIPRVFVEYGYSQYEEPMTGIRPGNTVELADAGAQLEMQLRNWLRARVAIARGIADSGIGETEREAGEANFFFSVSASF